MTFGNVEGFLILYASTNAMQKVKTDYMLVAEYDPKRGWSAPEIKPYGPLSLDPASSCFQYCPNVFEGMKVRQTSTEVPPLFLTHTGIPRARRNTPPIQATKKHGSPFAIPPTRSTPSKPLALRSTYFTYLRISQSTPTPF